MEENKEQVNLVAREMAKFHGWNEWDTATNCGHTLNGNDPDDERDFYRGLAMVAIRAIQPAPMPEEKVSGQVYGIIDPDYGRIYTIVRKLAWEEGYAIGLHGSFTRDLDLIAVPWDSVGHGSEHLIRRIVAATQLQVLHAKPYDPVKPGQIDTGVPGKKPHGRLVWTLMLPAFGDPRFVDLSIMPAQPEVKP